MYRIINENKNIIIKDDLMKDHFESYKYILKEFQEKDVSVDIDFQRKYKSFYAMGRKSEAFYKKYFALLQENKFNKDVKLGYIIRELYEINNRCEISFSSKMLHTINNENPIYDSNITNFFNIVKTNSSDKNGKIEYANVVYDFLCREYERIDKQELLKDIVDELRELYSLNEVSNKKIIDSIIWAFINKSRFDIKTGINKIIYM